MESQPSENCYHCGLELAGSEITTEINGLDRPMCCYGCKAVAEAIVQSGNADYYQFRETPGATGKEIVPEFLQTLQAYDNPIIQKQFVYHSDSHISEVSLILEGIVCSACVWLNEQYLGNLHGVHSVQINYSTHRATIAWDNSIIQLSGILEAISRIGYIAHPYDPQKQQQIFDSQRKVLIRQLGVSGLFGMQVMMFAVALYGGDYWGISPGFKIMFEWISMAMTVPVLMYSALPFFKGAYKDLKNWRAGMDVPVTLGMTLAFSASVYHTLYQNGEVYYDSVCMFVFLLLSVRLVELSARKKSSEKIESLLNLSPTMANKQHDDGNLSVVATAELCVGDKILVRSGEVIPTDGKLLSMQAKVDEAIITGESEAVKKRAGDDIIGGSNNLDQPIFVEVTHVGQDTVLSGVLRLIEKSQSHKPGFARLADKIASWFVLVLLVIVSITGTVWFYIDPTSSLGVMVATLVITCPCALSLATPAAISATIGRCTSEGIFVSKAGVLETLTNVDMVFFDKTGTLTQAKMAVDAIDVLSESDKLFLINLMCSMQAFSEHPIARAFAGMAYTTIDIKNFYQQTGKGIQCRYDGHNYYLGGKNWLLEKFPDQPIADQNQKAIYCFNDSSLLAICYLSDPLKTDAMTTVKRLQDSGKKVFILSGDDYTTVKAVAEKLNITQFFAEQLPQDKLDTLSQYQQLGHKVAMVGDGVNDAPVLAVADVAIAMSTGTDLATASADLMVKGLHTRGVADIFDISQKMIKIIKQNFAWAIGYNILAIPFAVSGYILPWVAAIGMSLSSLIVVLNAMRLKNKTAGKP